MVVSLFVKHHQVGIFCMAMGLEADYSHGNANVKYLFIYMLSSSQDMVACARGHPSGTLDMREPEFLLRVCGCLFLMPNYPSLACFAGWVASSCEGELGFTFYVNHCDSFWHTHEHSACLTFIVQYPICIGISRIRTEVQSLDLIGVMDRRCHLDPVLMAATANNKRATLILLLKVLLADAIDAVVVVSSS